MGRDGITVMVAVTRAKVALEGQQYAPYESRSRRISGTGGLGGHVRTLMTWGGRGGRRSVSFPYCRRRQGPRGGSPWVKGWHRERVYHNIGGVRHQGGGVGRRVGPLRAKDYCDSLFSGPPFLDGTLLSVLFIVMIDN